MIIIPIYRRENGSSETLSQIEGKSSFRQYFSPQSEWKWLGSEFAKEKQASSGNLSFTLLSS